MSLLAQFPDIVFTALVIILFSGYLGRMITLISQEKKLTPMETVGEIIR